MLFEEEEEKFADRIYCKIRTSSTCITTENPEKEVQDSSNETTPIFENALIQCIFNILETECNQTEALIQTISEDDRDDFYDIMSMDPENFMLSAYDFSLSHEIDKEFIEKGRACFGCIDLSANALIFWIDQFLCNEIDFMETVFPTFESMFSKFRTEEKVLVMKGIISRIRLCPVVLRVLDFEEALQVLEPSVIEVFVNKLGSIIEIGDDFSQELIESILDSNFLDDLCCLADEFELEIGPFMELFVELE